jgi:hypothetical protein
VTTSTRGQRHLEATLFEAVHEEQRRALANAYRTLDRLKDEQHRLSEQPWTPRPERRGQLVVLVRDAEQRVRELVANAEVERMFGLPPIPPAPAVVANGSSRGLPPAWYLPKPAAATRRRSRQR